MPTEAHFRRLERLYLRAPTNRYYDPRIEVSEGRSVVRLDIRPDFLHAAGAAHGSVYFKLLDDAAFFAANSVVEEHFVLTASFQLDFLRPVAEGEVRAEGRLVDESRRRLVADAELFDAAGRLLARGGGTFMVSSLELSAWDVPAGRED